MFTEPELDGAYDNPKPLLGVLERHCEAVGRDPAEITKTAMTTVDVLESVRLAGQTLAPIFGSVGGPFTR